MWWRSWQCSLQSPQCQLWSWISWPLHIHLRFSSVLLQCKTAPIAAFLLPMFSRSLAQLRIWKFKTYHKIFQKGLTLGLKFIDERVGIFHVTCNKMISTHECLNDFGNQNQVSQWCLRNTSLNKELVPSLFGYLRLLCQKRSEMSVRHISSVRTQWKPPHFEQQSIHSWLWRPLIRLSGICTAQATALPSVNNPPTKCRDLTKKRRKVSRHVSRVCQGNGLPEFRWFCCSIRVTFHTHVGSLDAAFTMVLNMVLQHSLRFLRCDCLSLGSWTSLGSICDRDEMSRQGGRIEYLEGFLGFFANLLHRLSDGQDEESSAYLLHEFIEQWSTQATLSKYLILFGWHD